VKVNILTLFPDMFSAVLSSGVIGRAAERGILEFDVTDIRDYTEDKHRKADDYPFGGGAGQLMTAQPLFSAIKALGIAPGNAVCKIAGPNAGTGFITEECDARNTETGCAKNTKVGVGQNSSLLSSNREPDDNNETDFYSNPRENTGLASKPRLIYLSPRGRLLDRELAEELSREQELVLLCGHYEGVDQRVLDAFDFEEISIGDYILTGGELPSMVLIDAVCRLIPGVLGSDDSHTEESIYSGLLEYPQYTRPACYEGIGVPDTLISGDHAKIALWNFEQSLKLTAERRPDLLAAWLADNYDGLEKKRKALAEPYLKK